MLLRRTLLAAERVLLHRFGGLLGGMRGELLALLALGLCGTVGRRRTLFLGRRGTCRNQIGRHGCAHLRSGGVMLAQEPGDKTALCEPTRAFVAGRTVRRERPGGVARVAQHGLGAQSRDAEPSRNDSPDQKNPSETGHLAHLPQETRRPTGSARTDVYRILRRMGAILRRSFAFRPDCR